MGRVHGGRYVGESKGLTTLSAIVSKRETPLVLQRVAEALAGVLGGRAELLLDAHDLVVLGRALRAARRSRFDLCQGTVRQRNSRTELLHNA